MKLRILSIACVYIMANNYIFSQWIQTNGPYGSINVSAIISHDSIKFVATTCGLFSSDNLCNRWNYRESINFTSYTQKGDSLFAGTNYRGVYLIDLAQSDIKSVPFGLDGVSIRSLAISDSCVFAGTEYGGFYKSVGFSNIWEQNNTGLPVETIIVPHGGGTYYVRFVYSIAKNSQYIFAGTQRGIYRADPVDWCWELKNTGLPLKPVSLIKAFENAIYACIENILYESIDYGDTWKALYTASSEVTSFNIIENILYITTSGAGIYYSTNNGSKWESFNNGLNDLDVNCVEKADKTLVCGTYSDGFYYFEPGQWKKNNSGIICSSVRSITSTPSALIANDYENVYILNEGNDWSIITPAVTKSYFGPLASMGDTIFLSVDYNTSSYPYDQPFILYSPDNGSTWKNMVHPVPFARDDPYRIYCYENRLYAFEDEMMCYTDNLGSTWKEISLPSDYCNQFNDFMVYLSTPFVATCGNAELVMLDDDEDWILSDNGLPTDREIIGLAYCQGAIFAYVYVYGMYVSLDNGNTWNLSTNGLDLEYGNGITSFAPSGENLFITTVNGIYYTNNYGQNWYSINSGLINKKIRDIEIFNDTLFVGTIGNGVWKCAINDIPVSLTDIISENNSIHIYPNPAADFIQISNKTGNRTLLISIFDLSGRKILSEKSVNNELNISEIKDGTYIISIISDELSVSDILIIRR